MDQLQKDIALALDLSEQIVGLAREKEWSQMEQLDLQRMDLLQAVFTGQSFSANELPPELQQKFQNIADLNAQAMELCSQAKDELLTDGKTLRRGRAALKAYKEQAPDD
jgi:hypothetical protein